MHRLAGLVNPKPVEAIFGAPAICAGLDRPRQDAAQRGFATQLGERADAVAEPLVGLPRDIDPCRLGRGPDHPPSAGIVEAAAEELGR